MDPNFLNALIGFGTGIGANLTTSALTSAFQKVFASRPDLQKGMLHPSSSAAFDRAVGDVAGILEALAGSGQINIDRGFITALKLAHFDHQDGRIHIGNTTISAPILQTGGTGSGTTVITDNTTLRSEGTMIQLGQGCRIEISGNASIKQT